MQKNEDGLLRGSGLCTEPNRVILRLRRTLYAIENFKIKYTSGYRTAARERLDEYAIPQAAGLDNHDLKMISFSEAYANHMF